MEKENKLRVAVCAIAKNENLYIREWVEYNKNIGVSKIFLYDNNEIDGERFDEVIDDYIKSGFVEVFDVRGPGHGDSYDERGINLQNKCYIECYYSLAGKFDWVCNIDIDEFLTFRNGFTLDSFLSQPVFEDCGTILISQDTYGDNDLIRYDSRPVLERFTTKSKKQDLFVKSIVKVGGTVLNETDFMTLHRFILKDQKTRYMNGAEFKYSDILIFGAPISISASLIPNGNCVIRHYKTKSTEEFFKRHVGRHWGKRPWDVVIDFDRCKSIYFLYNYPTDEKMAYIEEISSKYKNDKKSEKTDI